MQKSKPSFSILITRVIPFAIAFGTQSTMSYAFVPGHVTVFDLQIAAVTISAPSAKHRGQVGLDVQPQVKVAEVEDELVGPIEAGGEVLVVIVEIRVDDLRIVVKGLNTSGRDVTIAKIKAFLYHLNY